MLVIGADGGGSKTVARVATVLTTTSGPVIDRWGQGTSGPSNPQAVGFEAAADNLRLAIRAAYSDLGVSPSPKASACLAVAGSDREQDRERLTQLLQRPPTIAAQLTVVNDALPLLAIASPECLGVALISGTGSFAWGRNADGEERRCGGWGYLLGDQGSGYRIGLDALQAIARADDGIAAPSLLTAAVLETWNLVAPADLVRHVYSGKILPADIAQIAGQVFEAAQQGDEVALAIVQRAADELAKMVGTIAEQLHLSAFPLAVGGGLLLGQPELHRRVDQALADGGYQCHAVDVAEPVLGALQIALDQS